MFPNLSAELSRKRISTRDFAKCLGVTEKSVNNKMSGRTEFTLSEIQKTISIFPGMSIDYLFEKKEA